MIKLTAQTFKNVVSKCKEEFDCCNDSYLVNEYKDVLTGLYPCDFSSILATETNPHSVSGLIAAPYVSTWHLL